MSSPLWRSLCRDLSLEDEDDLSPFEEMEDLLLLDETDEDLSPFDDLDFEPFFECLSCGFFTLRSG